MKDIKYLKVLFVEDEKLAREKLASILGKIFITVQTAQNGQEALDIYNKALFEEPFDLIVSDINMPIMNGLEMIEVIRNNNDEIPIIFTTARNETEYLLKAIELNANHYIIKPIELGVLITKVKEVCEKTLIKKSLEIKKEEMENLVSALDNFAAVCKFDKDGNIISMNDIFCDNSLFDKEELLQKNIKDLICDQTNKISLSTLWQSIKDANKWRGTIKKLAKDGTEYYVNVIIMPIKNEITYEIKEFIAIEYLVTDDEKKKKHLQGKLYETLQLIKKREVENQKELDRLKSSFQSQSQAGNFDSAKVRMLVEKIKSLQNQIMHTEDEIKKLRDDRSVIVTKANTKVNQVMDSNTSLKRELEVIKTQRNDVLSKHEETQKKVKELEERIREKNKRIEYLMDVITIKEKKIEQLELESL